MKKNNIFFTLAVTIFFLATPILPGQVNPSMQGPNPGVPQDLAQKLENVDWNQVNGEIAQWVDTLPPDQQQQFYKDVNEMTNVMSTMSEEELSSFMNSVLSPGQVPMLPGANAGQQPAQPMPTAVPEPEQKTEPIPQVTIPQKPKKKIDEALSIIKNISACIERFLRKAHIIQELPGKIERWVEQKKVREWKAGLTWDELKGQIESLDQKLKKMMLLDPKTKQYRYLPALLDNEALYNNMAKLSANLLQHEPLVKAPQFGLGQVSKSSRTAIKEVLSAFAEAIYLLGIPKGLDAAIAKYEPRAKELSGQEEAARKLALDESKKPIASKPMQVAGKQQIYGIPKTTTREPSYAGGYTPSYGPGYGPTDYERATGPKAPEGQKTGPEKAGEPEKKSEPAKIEPDKKTDNYIKELDRLLNSADDVVAKTPVMNALFAGKGITKELTTDIDFAAGRLSRALDELRTIKVHLLGLSSAQKKMYEQEVKETILRHETMLQQLHTQKVNATLSEKAGKILVAVDIGLKTVTIKDIPAPEEPVAAEATGPADKPVKPATPWYRGGAAHGPMTKEEAAIYERARAEALEIPTAPNAPTPEEMKAAVERREV